MFSALVFVGLILMISFGGKAILVMLASLPLIGPIAGGYMEYVGPIGDGLTANLIYGAMFMQLALIALSPLMYGSSFIRKAVTLCRARRQNDS